jgi:hypothetical protein
MNKENFTLKTKFRYIAKKIPILHSKKLIKSLIS